MFSKDKKAEKLAKSSTRRSCLDMLTIFSKIQLRPSKAMIIFSFKLQTSQSRSRRTTKILLLFLKGLFYANQSRLCHVLFFNNFLLMTSAKSLSHLALQNKHLKDQQQICKQGCLCLHMNCIKNVHCHTKFRGFFAIKHICFPFNF